MKVINMKILFWGGTGGNIGPVNINKGVVPSLSDRFWTVTAQGKYRELLDALWKLLRSDVVMVSGVSRKGAILVVAAKLLGKKSVYLMHGCAEWECRLNGIQPNKKGLAQEVCLMKHADLLLPVSRRYMLWLKEQYPQYAGKMDYIYNGVDEKLFEYRRNGLREPGSVAVSGGMIPLKNNMSVVRAVEALDGKAYLRIYRGERKPLPGEYRYAERMGTLPKAEFLHRLTQTELFVLNSSLESFSIATMDALACGCSLLVSEVAGVCDLLALEETDIIHDPMDVDELRSKIEYLLDNPNYERLRSQFDPEQWSFSKMVENLERKCIELKLPQIRN